MHASGFLCLNFWRIWLQNHPKSLPRPCQACVRGRIWFGLVCVAGLDLGSLLVRETGSGDPTHIDRAGRPKGLPKDDRQAEAANSWSTPSQHPHILSLTDRRASLRTTQKRQPPTIPAARTSLGATSMRRVWDGSMVETSSRTRRRSTFHMRAREHRDLVLCTPMRLR